MNANQTSVNNPISGEPRRKILEAIHDSAVDAIITIDDRGIIETVNPATETMFGYASNEMIGQNISLLMPNPYRDEHDEYLKNYLRTGVAKIIGIGREVVAQKKDGSIFPMHLAVSEVKLGDRCVFAGFIRDLSDLKRYEEQQATLGRIIEESLNEVFIFDAETLRFIQVNRGGRENLGYTQRELCQLTPVDLNPKYTMDQFRAMLQPLLDGKIDKLEFSSIHLRKDGSVYDVDVHLQVSTYLSKPVFVAIILDLTDRRKAEREIRQQQEHMHAELERLVETRTEELREAQAELVRSEKFSTLGKVSGGIAHEIRNPLNAVKTSAYFLLNAKDLPEEKIKEHLERIDRQVSMIDNVVTALSDVAKLPEAILIPIRIESMIRNIVSSTELPSNITCRFDFPESLPDVMADESQISIAFRNLVRNARDAMSDGGTLTLRAIVAGDQVNIIVEDTGIGIAKHDLKMILEPLFTTKARGMGLGLSITRAIVDKNQGSLSAESEVGVGSQFCISLKRNKEVGKD